MQPSQRIQSINAGGSDGWDVFNKARQMISEGTDVIELTIGEHDIKTAPKILHAMQAAAKNGNTGYASIPGLPALRDAVAHRYQERTGVPTTRDNVLIVPGGQSGLFASHLAVTDPGDRALFIDPYYATYPGTIRALGAVPIPVPAAPEHGFQPQETVIAAAAKGAKSLLINSPNNPTGTIYTEATLAGIARQCQEQDLWLISDEVYDTQVWQGRHISPRSLPGMADRCLVVNSLSKSHAMTGSRIGWVIGPEDMIEALINLATNTTYGVAGFVQEAGLFALNEGKALESEVARPFRRRRDLVRKLLKGQDRFGIVPADGAMYVMLDIRPTGLSGEDFAFALLEKEHIAVMPGESFGKAAAGHVRIALTVEERLLETSFLRLLAFAESLRA